ncbi:MAG: DUF4965 domain-containing protein [Ruminococcaceae bacterium]|nr:DUF4965 domain-containing protein [Oscillospiraceae bacterium]
MKLRAPAVPLITVDPYFSVWSPSTTLNAARTMHWTGKNNSIIGTVTVDGKQYSFLGYHRDLHKMIQTSLEIDALSTTATFETAEITLTAAFTTPLLPHDLHRLTRPVSYMALSYQSKDGKPHEVVASVSASEELCLDKPCESPVEVKVLEGCDGICGSRIGNTVQKPLNRSGDDLRIDWGYFYLCVAGKNGVNGTSTYHKQTLLTLTAPMTEGKETLYLFAYDDVKSIEYFGRHLCSYWNKDGMTVEAAISEAAAEYTAVKEMCDAFSAKLTADAEAAGGEQYAELLTLAYRQVIAAHKLVLDEDGEVLFISKECFSNGCAATVDVSYPSIPMFLLYNPELVKGMMRPIYKYAATDAWKFDFAPHDVGQYPLLNGQVYGENALSYQMPVEECGNMLIMEANVALATGSADFAAAHLDVLKGWCDYLLQYGADPADQLCTDDFAGHLAHNCNLSLKAVMGITGMSILMEMLGDKAAAADYRKKAEDMAAIWMATAIDADGSGKLAFDQPGTYSMKYNMVWDKVWGTGMFSQEFRNTELASNETHFNDYGMPLDSRADYTKSDWLVWTASMAETKAAFERYIAPMWRAFHESESRVPMTDWYDTVTARIVTFQHRSVQGGLFMKLLMEKWKK